MSDRPNNVEPPSEAFGQSSASRYVVGILIALSMIFSGISLAMWKRSHETSDAFYKDTVDGRVMVRSIYGRLIITRTVLEDPPLRPIGNDWNYIRRDVPENIRDGWPPGFWKSVGVQQGVDLNPDQNVAQERWLRIRWPTIAFITGLFPAVYVLRRSWRERVEEKMDQEFAFK